MSRPSTADVLATMNAQPPKPPSPTPTALPGKPVVVRSRQADTVRFTFDVSREQHRFIKHYVLDAQTTASAATRTLWDLVAEDNALAQRLGARLAAQNAVTP